MNKMLASLIAIILLLVVIVAFLLGRNTKTVQAIPATQQSTSVPIGLQTQPAVVTPPAETTLVGIWAADVGNNLLDWYNLKSDGSGSEYHADSAGSSQQIERTFRWSQEGNILHLSDIVMPGVNVNGLPTTLDYGCHMSTDRQSFSQGFDPDGTKPALDSIPDLIYKRK